MRLCNHWSKLKVTTVRKCPANEAIVGLLSFLIVWILDTINMVLLFFQFGLKMVVYAALMKKKTCEVNNFWCIFKKCYFRVDVFSRRVSFPFKYFKYGKPISWWSWKKNKNFPFGVNHVHDTDLSKYFSKYLDLSKYWP